MAIKKEVVMDATGASASYHVIGNVSIDATAKVTIATVMSYVSEDTFKADKLPLQGGQSISVSGMPKDNEGAFAYIQKRLVEPKPAGDNKAADTPMLYGSVDRYMLADGEIVA